MRTLGAAAAGSESNVARIVVADGARWSGTRYQRRMVGSITTPMALAGREAAAVAVGAGAVGVGLVAAGVHEAAASATVNTCARYLKGKWPSRRSGAGSCPKRPGMYRMVSPGL